MLRGYMLNSMKQFDKSLVLNFFLNSGMLYLSDNYSIHDFAWVRLKKTNHKVHFISIKKHELSKDLKVSMQVQCNETSYDKTHICLEDWSDWYIMGETTKNFFELSVMLNVSKVGLIKKVYKDEEFTDFQLKAVDGCVPVHRTILAAHSDVFKTMLNGEWKETAQGFIEIEGTTLQTLRHLKDYMYLDTLPDQGFQELLLIAKRYMLDDLYKACNMKLIQTVKGENLNALLDFAIANGILQLAVNIFRKLDREHPHDDDDDDDDDDDPQLCFGIENAKE